MSNVVTMHGDKIVAPYEPVDNTIAELEGLLERAKSGEVKGIYAVIVHGDDSASCTSTLMASYRAVGALSTLAAELSLEIINEGK